MPSFPTVRVEVAFSVTGTTGTTLHLDDPTRGKLDTATLATDDTWTDVTAYATPQGGGKVTTRRGSNRVEGPAIRYEASQCTVLLDNSDRRFDPTNTSGPYTAAGVTQITPMRAVRILADWSGTTYELFRGYVDEWQLSYDDPGYAEVTLTASDAFKVLGNINRDAATPVGTGETSGARINRILDSVSWPAADRVVATGDTTLQATTLDGDALNEMFLVQDTELGELYVDGGGRVVFRNRSAIFNEARSNVSQATFGDDPAELSYQDVTVAYDDTGLVNRAQIAREGGTQQTADNIESQQQWLVRTHNRTDLLMQTDTTALDYAQFLVFIGKDPELRFASLSIPAHEDDTLWPHVLGREIGDRITVRRRPPGGGSTIERDVFIRGIQHEITDRWITTWTLQSATKYSFLVLDNSVLGKLDQNALAY